MIVLPWWIRMSMDTIVIFTPFIYMDRIYLFNARSSNDSFVRVVPKQAQNRKKIEYFI